MLSYPRPVAETSSDAARLALGLWEIQKLDRNLLAELAITSESPDLPFTDRICVIADNLRLVPETPPKRAAVIAGEICEALGGPVELAKLVLVDPGKSDSVTMPYGPSCPRQQTWRVWRPSSKWPCLRSSQRLLRALGVPTIDAAGLRSRTVVDFAAIWAPLDTGGRLALLAWLAGEDAALPANASNLDTVLVGDGDGKWVSPFEVIAPSWTSPCAAKRAFHLDRPYGRSSATGTSALGPLVRSSRS